jgi:hypothetical protein
MGRDQLDPAGLTGWRSRTVDSRSRTSCATAADQRNGGSLPAPRGHVGTWAGPVENVGENRARDRQLPMVPAEIRGTGSFRRRRAGSRRIRDDDQHPQRVDVPSWVGLNQSDANDPRPTARHFLWSRPRCPGLDADRGFLLARIIISIPLGERGREVLAWTSPISNGATSLAISP